ncbi:anti-sigma-K factor RskA [Actinoplanes lutulentus]|uniref:Anti-sigma-K factor rskA n=1 Tax=Actinoplanes lutulentus TaxID=1287878 RepID=A0A327ZAT5_9ACTN|nr:anti-sigma factor [Actinoplanes lutulentus]MBB2947145.1 anti-sigma-K factor RskA [Actinoplanes lutulentus]RAK36421.1 anti-sigma-K factor rskA [Actinoplanes lutulentus]
MQHLDPDRLVLLALSEEQFDLDESDHLAQCAGCRYELDALRDVAEIGAEVQGMRDLPAPPERVWRAIEAEVTVASTRPLRSVSDSALRVPQGVERRKRAAWLKPVLAAAAAAVLAVAGTVTVTRLLDRPAAEQVTARATLSPLPAVNAAAGGSVRVLSDGVMRIDVRNLPLTTGFHEVWLIDPDDVTKMVALGTLPDAADVVLPVPPGTDLNRYRLVDVSDEPHDGDATHSGRSLLRGTLTY